MEHYCDSTGKTISVGDTVRWRGELYTIKAFRPGEGRRFDKGGPHVAAIDFEEPLHVAGTPDEISVDIVDD